MSKNEIPKAWTKKQSAETEDLPNVDITDSKVKKQAGSFVDKTITKNEELLYRGHLSLFGYFWQICLIIIFGLSSIVNIVVAIVTKEASFFGFSFLITVILIAWVALGYYFSEFAVTNKKVITKTGVISRETFEYPIRKIESIQVKQTVLGRIFNYGNLELSGAGNATPIIKFISKPMEMRNVISDEVDKRDV